MRGSSSRAGGKLVILATLFCGVCVIWPLLAGGGAAMRGFGDAVPEGAQPLSGVLLTTTGFAALVAVIAMMLGWAPGRWLGTRGTGRGAMLGAAALVLPLCLPAYLVFYTWWQAWPADSALHAWAAGRGLVPRFREITMVVGLSCWSWPIVAWCTAACVAGVPRERGDLLDLDGVSGVARLRARWATDGPGVLIGGAVVFLLTFNNTTTFDLAQVFSVGNELRARAALGAAPGALLRDAAPALILAAAGAIAGWVFLSRLADRPSLLHPDRAGRGVVAGTAAIWGITVLIPLILLLRGVIGQSPGLFLDLYGRSLWNSVGIAALTALAAATLAVALTGAWMIAGRRMRIFLAWQSMAWLLFALLPGTAAGALLEAAWNRGLALPEFLAAAPKNETGALAGASAALDVTLADLMYRKSVILVLGHLGRAGVIAAVLARWMAAREPRALFDLRQLDDDRSLRRLLIAARPQMILAAGASAALAFVFSIGEVPVTAYVHPAGSDPLAMRVLNAMHYQRADVVLMTAVVLIGLAVGAALLLAGLTAHRRRIAATAVLLLPLLIAVPGCGPEDGDPLRTQAVFGSTGVALGQFAYPRCIDVDRTDRTIYVVDKTARIQRFSADGIPEMSWSMPERENGKPTGISIAPDGRVFVADTHYYRVIVFDRDGTELLRFGEYGEGPGQFIYVTDIAFGPDNRIYVAEYGGNDRVQVFDDQGTYLFEFGQFGEGPNDFQRPQSIAINPEATELYIADSCRHRIMVTDLTGQVLRTFGSPGTEPGQMHYPYGLDFLPDGSLLVTEFGNNRLQRFDPTGKPLGTFGCLGAGDGEVQYPWGVAVLEENVYVLDSGNNRVQIIGVP